MGGFLKSCLPEKKVGVGGVGSIEVINNSCKAVQYTVIYMYALGTKVVILSTANWAIATHFPVYQNQNASVTLLLIPIFFNPTLEVLL